MLEEIRNVHRQAKHLPLGEIGTIRIGHPGSVTYSFLPDLLAKISTKNNVLKACRIDYVNKNLAVKFSVALSGNAALMTAVSTGMPESESFPIWDLFI